MEAITYHRKPTQGEIKFGEGATHYKDFEPCFCWNDDNTIDDRRAEDEKGNTYYFVIYKQLLNN